MKSGQPSKSEGCWKVRFLIWQGLSVVFGLAVVWQTLRLEWTNWQMLLVFVMAKELMAGTIGLMTPPIRRWTERVIWRKSSGFSAFLCSLHIHPWLIPVLFPSLHDFTFALWMHGMVVFSAIVLHRFPVAYRGQLAAFLAGLTALMASSNGGSRGVCLDGISLPGEADPMLVDPGLGQFRKYNSGLIHGRQYGLIYKTGSDRDG